MGHKIAAGNPGAPLFLFHCIAAAAIDAASRICEAAIETRTDDTLPARRRKLMRCGQSSRDDGR
jgi:hypothetical protein